MTTLKRTLDETARRAIAARTEALFRASGALREGHFALKSGRHSRCLPGEVPGAPGPGRHERAVRVLGGPAHAPGRHGVRGPGRRAHDGRRDPRLRDRPPAGDPGDLRRGGRLATTGPRREFRRGFTIVPGEKVLLVDDILTTGGSLLAMIPAVEALGGEIVECCVLVDRSGGLATLTSPATGRVYPLRPLWRLELPTYEPGPERVRAARPASPRSSPGAAARGWRPREPARGGRSRPPRPGRPRPRAAGRRVVPGGIAAAALAPGPSSTGPGRGARRPAAALAAVGASPASRRRPAVVKHRLPGPHEGHGVHAAHGRRRRDPVHASAPSRTAPSSRRATSPSTWRRRAGPGLLPRRGGARSSTASRTHAGAATALPLRPRDRLEGRLRAPRPSTTPSNEPRTIPSPSTAKIHGSDRMPHSSTDGTDWSWPFGVQHGLEAPLGERRSGTARR